MKKNKIIWKYFVIAAAFVFFCERISFMVNLVVDLEKHEFVRLKMS